MQFDLMTIIITSLATYRVARLVVLPEEGPFGLMRKFRGIADPDQKTWVGRGLDCSWCVSFWIAPLALYAVRYDMGALLVGGLAVSALVGLAVQCGGILLNAVERLLTRPRR